MQSLADARLPLADGLLQLFKGTAAELHIAGDVGQEELTLIFYNLMHISRQR